MDDTDPAFEADPELAEMHEEGAGTATLPPNHGPIMRAYARCRHGFVHAIALVDAGLRHPFGDDVEMHIMGQAADPARDHVVDVTGIECHQGYLVDNKGNVAPAGTRVDPLRPEDPGYLDHHEVSPVGTGTEAAILSRPPVDAPSPTPPAEKTDAMIEGKGEAEGHQDHGHNENHGSGEA